MRPVAVDQTSLGQIDLAGQRLLIFIVAYNAETTIEKVLSRIPSSLHQNGVEVLLIDDSSRDETFLNGLRYQQAHSAFKITVLRTPANQGYGGNQKLGYRYAIDHGFDLVALVHGDGQYAPEKLPALLTPLLEGKADAVFGSRMLDKKSARAGGMPFYKRLGNRILTRFQNRLLGTSLSEFHSGYRVYSTRALAEVPFEKNTRDFHFDTEIIIQFVLKGFHIAELPIPTFYGDEVCHVNGLKYAWDVFRATMKGRLCGWHLFYDRKFDLHPSVSLHSDKLDFPSSQSFTVESARPGATILLLGLGHVHVTAELERRGCRLTTIDFSQSEMAGESPTTFVAPRLQLPSDLSGYDQIFLTDLVEHLHDPEGFMDDLRNRTGGRCPEIVVTAANVAFFVTRTMLALGHFNYSRKGILGLGHRRLFTFRSLRALLEQAGYEVLEARGVPAPYPLATGRNRWSRLLLALNQALLRLSKGLFSYQICLRARALPHSRYLLQETIAKSAGWRDEVATRVA
ncbi:MAG: bifunctional glycosyltransferase/class I SAM-dependent methyltransferase [Verrucomicrobiota bacterium]|nr:bifunctional glycosyltransferase/class I SAM-dependent methyltransferase [Verrucomicrobiota bacterium]